MRAVQLTGRERAAALVRRATGLGLRLALLALPFVAAGWYALSGDGAHATGPGDPHASATSTCAACHRTHTSQGAEILAVNGAQHALCLTCHNGTGADSNVQSELTGLPADNPATGAYYQHPVLAASSLNHTSASDDEFAGVRNRHSECTDCHNPHTMPGHTPSMTSTGWTPSGLISETAGVALPAPGSWVAPTTLEYQLCLKCHSAYTIPRDDSTATERNKTFDKAAELGATTGSFHPVAKAGTNQTAVLQANLQAGRLWRFNTGDTIRCTNCHGNRLLVNYSSSMLLETPARNAVLAPHGSTNRSILIANYVDAPGTALAYNEGNYALCFLCHDPDVFSGSSTNTNFPLHKQHVVDQGAVCAECHYRLHSTKSAFYPANADYARLVNFAPDVTNGGVLAPVWSLASQSCTLTCHGKSHSASLYTGSGAGGTSSPAGTPGSEPDGAHNGVGAKLPSGSTDPTATVVPPTPTPRPTSTPTPTPTPRLPRTIAPTATPSPTPTPAGWPAGTPAVSPRR